MWDRIGSEAMRARSGTGRTIVSLLELWLRCEVGHFG